MLREYSSVTINKRADAYKNRQELIENISAAIQSRNLKTRDVKAVDPSITRNNVCDLRAGVNPGISIERLERLADKIWDISPSTLARAA
jgi:hypothetical protein